MNHLPHLRKGTIMYAMFALICLMAVLSAVPAACVQYWLSPDGSDAAAGTRAAPWQSLAKASAAVQPGDTVTLLPGAYPGCLEPAVSGEPDKPITFRADKPLTARLSGGGASSDGKVTCARLKQRDHIVIENLNIEPDQPQMWLQMDGCQRCIIRGVRMQNGGGSYIPAGIRDCHYCRFEKLDASRAMQIGANGHVSGNMMQLNASTHNVITDCRFGKTGHDPFCMWIDSTHNVVRRCVFNCVWGRNFEFFTAPHNLIEGCVITNGYHGSGSADGRAKLFIWDGIFRRNLIYRNWYQPLTIHAYKYQEMDPFGMINSRLYHNTFYRNYESGFEMFDIGRNPDPHMVRGNVLQNNLFADNDPDGDGLQLGLDVGIARDNRFRHNVFFAGKADMPTIKYNAGWPAEIADRPKSQLRTPTEANQQLPEQFIGNSSGDPQFVAPAKDDYRLGKGSKAVEAGEPLTVAREAGKGKLLPVEDARVFYDGFGIPGEVGDLLFIGPKKQPARVILADVENQRLQLDRSVTWQKGDAVTLPYTGKAPDAGAYEAGAEKELWYLAPRPTPDLRIATMETATGPFAVAGFERENLEEWFYWWYTHRQRNAEAKIDDTTAATGKRSLRIDATADNSTLSALLQPPWWDIDRYPIVRFAYRIPPGVPVGVRLDAFPTEKRGYGAMYVGGSAGRSKNANDLGKVILIDDDQWHEATVDVRLIREVYPEVKLLRTFYFYTNGNGKKGQQFWFDDFRIEQK
ncbi:MAG: right-handed parallel beta-helix repeat-containing protein [Armatimonadota bacterium]